MSSSIASSTANPITVSFEPPTLTTTFIPPPECTANHLTMMENLGFFIYLNEPLPVPESTFTSCYPSQVGNSWLLNYAGTTLPAFSPLVCPQNYQTVLNGTEGSGYIACCPSGYLLAPPKTTIGDRSAYGGTCYTPLSTTTVTSYANSSLGGTILFPAPSTAQAYAYPIDGFALVASDDPSSRVTATITPITISSMASNSIASTAPASTAPAASDSSSSSDHLASGAIAGIAVAGVAFMILLAAVSYLFIRNHRLKAQLGRTGYRSDAKELPSDSRPFEMPDTSPTEVDGSSFSARGEQAYYHGQDGKSGLII